MNLFKILEAAEAAELEYSTSSAALADYLISEYEERARTSRDLGHGPDADEPDEDW
ncbi:hypothetical protein TPB0596_33770 [Tsukamurella pulmonis]|uniref:hypothetical protein n=1 Tax=Tsukamurella pulmonis TaxID=47312 RepID=UPI001EE0089E|nr:hypothetical protein [Tsukamurella pulmonis]BDD83614.1 hypothetical protein TPB0596_33770 [Tsukamurella pulmonis]